MWETNISVSLECPFLVLITYRVWQMGPVRKQRASLFYRCSTSKPMEELQFLFMFCSAVWIDNWDASEVYQTFHET